MPKNGKEKSSRSLSLSKGTWRRPLLAPPPPRCEEAADKLLLFPPSISSGIRQENYFDPFDKLRDSFKS